MAKSKIINCFSGKIRGKNEMRNENKLYIHDKLVELFLEALEIDMQGIEIDCKETEKIINEYEIDSLDMVKFMVAIEAFFNIEINDDLLLSQNDSFFNDIEAYLENKLNQTTEFE